MNGSTRNSQVFDLTDDDINLEAGGSRSTTPTSPRTNKNEATGSNAAGNAGTDCWSIDDDPFFHPLGLLAHDGNSVGKCVFVTWSCDYLLNFVFKISAHTKRTRMTKVRLSLEPDDEIIDVLITELNTLLLMRSGRVYYFSSVKSIHPIDWLPSGVRCISSSSMGFSLIRLHEGNLLHLEIYRDVIGVGKSSTTLMQSYDITFDSNLFNCSWMDDHFTLHTQAVEHEEHIHFLEQVVGRCCQLRVDQEVHFFTVSGHVFALIADVAADADMNQETTASDFTIQLLCSYASNVAFMQVLLEQKMCLVFLECGSIDIWYMSTRTNDLRRQTHHTGAEYTHYHYAKDTDCFYYTDERCVAQLRFVYDAGQDVCHVRECIKCLQGILAITWTTSLQQLVCLSCNNFFYRLTFDNDEDHSGERQLSSSNGNKENLTEFEDLNELYDMTTERVTELLHKADAVHQLTLAPQQIHKAIEKQYTKRQLISVAHKSHLYQRVCKAYLQYCSELPTTHAADTMLLYTKPSWTAHTESVYAVIRFNITDSDNAVFQSASWQLQVAQSDGITHIFHIPNESLYVPLCIVVPLVQRQRSALPEFQLKLLASLGNANDSEFVMLALPIELQTNAESYVQLLSHTVRRLSNNCTSGNALNHILEAHFKNNNTKALIDNSAHLRRTTIKYLLHLSDSENFERLVRIFKVPIQPNKQFTLYFMTSTLHISCPCIEQQFYLQLESDDPVALYYAKLFLSKCFPNSGPSSAGKSSPNKGIQTFHTFVERTYNMLLLQQHDEQLPQSQQEQEQHETQRIYDKLRLGYATHS